MNPPTRTNLCRVPQTEVDPLMVDLPAAGGTSEAWPVCGVAVDRPTAGFGPARSSWASPRIVGTSNAAPHRQRISWPAWLASTAIFSPQGQGRRYLALTVCLRKCRPSFRPLPVPTGRGESPAGSTLIGSIKCILPDATRRVKPLAWIILFCDRLSPSSSAPWQ